VENAWRFALTRKRRKLTISEDFQNVLMENGNPNVFNVFGSEARKFITYISSSVSKTTDSVSESVSKTIDSVSESVAEIIDSNLRDYIEFSNPRDILAVGNGKSKDSPKQAKLGVKLSSPYIKKNSFKVRDVEILSIIGPTFRIEVVDMILIIDVNPKFEVRKYCFLNVWITSSI
jgi:hypothetical protein